MVGVMRLVTTPTSHAGIKFQRRVMEAATTRVRSSVRVLIVLIMVMVQTFHIVAYILVVGGVPTMVRVMRLVTTLLNTAETKFQGTVMEVVTMERRWLTPYVFVLIVMAMV